MSISCSIVLNSSALANCPRERITLPSSSLVIVPSPSLSNSLKASRNSVEDKKSKKKKKNNMSNSVLLFFLEITEIISTIQYLSKNSIFLFIYEIFHIYRHVKWSHLWRNFRAFFYSFFYDNLAFIGFNE